MAKIKSYKVVANVGVVGFNGVIHAPGDVITSDKVPDANLRAWLRFKQIEEVDVKAETAHVPRDSEEKTKGKK